MMKMGQQTKQLGQSRTTGAMPENLHIAADPARHETAERLYVEVRKKEGRLYSDEVVRILPRIGPDHPLSHEWSVRSASCDRLCKHLLTRNKPLSILDLGCGNGWMANALSGVCDSMVTAVDLNLLELEQGARVFEANKRLQFVYGDIFDGIAIEKSYDVIVCASSIQYFPDLRILIGHLLTMLKEGGEIHILDSPLYSEDEIEQARERSRSYYHQVGFERMAASYYHHTWQELQGFAYSVVRRSFLDRIKSKIFSEINPFFPWVIIKA